MAKTCRCGGTASIKTVKIKRNIGGRHIVFNNVPVSVCQNCNEQYLSAKVLKQMDRLLMKNPESDEIDYGLDVIEQRFYEVIKKLEKHDIVPPRDKVDMPIGISDVYFAMDRMSKLREEQVYI